MFLKVSCYLVVALWAVAYGLPGENDREHVWKVGNLSYPFPSNAVLGGFDANGFDIYVGRVKYLNSVLPGRVVAETGIAYFNTETVASQTTAHDLLVAERNFHYVWVRSFDGFFEKGLVSVGTSVKNERVFLCRAKTDGGLHFGPLFLTQKFCYIKNGNSPLRKLDKYEVLVAVPKGNGTCY